MDINDKLKGYIPDPNHQKENEKRDAIIARRAEQLKIEQRDFIEDWMSHGFPDIESISEIKTLKKKLDSEQVEFILKWIPRIANTYGSQEMFVRTLILAAQPFDGFVLMALFDDPDSSFLLKWAIGNTIESAKVLHVTQWLKSKFETLSLGKEKEMLVLALRKYLDTEEARDCLLKIYDNYPLHAADTLAKIGNREDLDFMINKLSVYKGPSKTLIKKAINKLEKRLIKNGL